jgi:hypothetical protein
MQSVYERFMASTNIDYDRWKEGEGYDLEALRALEPDEQFRLELWLLGRVEEDWRDLEALLVLGTDTARAAVVNQLRNGKLEQRLNAARLLADDEVLAKELAPDIEAAAVAGLGSALLFYGLSIALDLATTLRTPALIDALFRAALRDEGEASVHAAARLAYIHGKAKEPFDWELRPLFLRFNTQDRAEREVVFRELCTLCGVDPEPYLKTRT